MTTIEVPPNSSPGAEPLPGQHPNAIPEDDTLLPGQLDPSLEDGTPTSAKHPSSGRGRRPDSGSGSRSGRNNGVTFDDTANDGSKSASQRAGRTSSIRSVKSDGEDPADSLEGSAGSPRMTNTGESVLGQIFLKGKHKRTVSAASAKSNDQSQAPSTPSASTSQVASPIPILANGTLNSNLEASQQSLSQHQQTGGVSFRSQASSLDGSREQQLIEERQEKMKASIQASRVALKKVQRVFEKAEAMIDKSFDKAFKGRANPDPIIATYVDEYIKVCRMHCDATPPPNLHNRWMRLMDDMRTLRFDLNSVSEHVKSLSVESQKLASEAYGFAKPIAIDVVRQRDPQNVFQCSERTIVDPKSGLVIQQWPNAEAPKRYCKSLSRFINAPLCIFDCPLIVVFEVCGHSFTATSVTPIREVIRHPCETYPWVKYNLDAAISNWHFPINDKTILRDSLFGLGLDGRLYCFNAASLVPHDFSDSFLADYEGSVTDVETVKKSAAAATDRVCTDLIALSRANFPKVSSIMHKFGLKVQHAHLIHGALSRAESVRENTVGVAEDANLTAAIRAVVSELLARVLKLVLREEFQKLPSGDEETMASQMGALASQLVFSQIIEDSENTGGGHIYKATLKHTYRMFSQYGIPKKALWGDHFVVESHIAQRVAHFTGLAYVNNVIAGISCGRLVRATTFNTDNPRLNALRGRQREMMQKLVSRIKSSRKHSPHCTSFLTFQLADLFHQTTGRTSVSGSPKAIYEQVKAADDSVYATEVDTTVINNLALQQVYLHGAKLAGDPTLLGERFRDFLDHMHTLTQNPEDPLTAYYVAMRVRTLCTFSRCFPHQANLVQALETTQSGLQPLVRAGKIHEKHAFWLWEDTWNGIMTTYMATKPTQAIKAGHLRLEHALSVFGQDSLPTAAAYNEIAATLVAQNDLQGAEKAFRKAFDLFVLLNDIGPTAFTTANNLGYTYFRMADERMPPKLKKQRYSLLRFRLPEEVQEFLDSATDVFEFVVEHRSKADPSVLADALNNLGTVWLYRGRFFRAVESITESLQVTRGIYSDEHPDRASALHNLKVAEKRMRGNAALFISCWYRRFLARKQLRLLKHGSQHAQLFQRVGRGFFLRVQLYWLAEKKRMKKAVNPTMALNGSTTAFGSGVDKKADGGITESLAFDDDDDDPYKTQEEEQPKKVLLRRKPKEEEIPDDLQLHSGTFGTEESGHMSKKPETEIYSGDGNGADKATEVTALLQRVGRAMLTRKMLHKLAAMKASRKPKGKK